LIYFQNNKLKDAVSFFMTGGDAATAIFHKYLFSVRLLIFNN